MIKIEFGHANEINPKGAWEGIHISPDLPLLSADYYGAMQLGEDSYIVAKVVDDDGNRYPELLNNFIVRRALADMYVDGSGWLFLDQEKSHECNQIERFLNSDRIKQRINNSEDVINLCSEIGAHRANNSFRALELDHEKEPLISTSIRHEEFEKKKNALSHCRHSMSDMQRQIEELSRQLEETRKANIR